MGIEVISSSSQESCRGVISSGERALPIISFNAQESQPCTSLGQHSRADPSGEGGMQMNQSQELELWRADSATHLPRGGGDAEVIILPSLTPHYLQQLEELALGS